MFSLLVDTETAELDIRLTCPSLFILLVTRTSLCSYCRTGHWIL